MGEERIVRGRTLEIGGLEKMGKEPQLDSSRERKGIFRFISILDVFLGKNSRPSKPKERANEILTEY